MLARVQGLDRCARMMFGHRRAGSCKIWQRMFCWVDKHREPPRGNLLQFYIESRSREAGVSMKVLNLKNVWKLATTSTCETDTIFCCASVARRLVRAAPCCAAAASVMSSFAHGCAKKLRSALILLAYPRFLNAQDNHFGRVLPAALFLRLC